MNTQIVPGTGPLDCKICFVGEAPGAQEVRQGKPFVGPAGMLFDRLLRSAGIIRDQCYITNVIKIRPPNNNISVFLDINKKYPIETDIYNESLSLLKEELKRCSANIIVAIGATALWALCGLKQVTKRRGSILESTLLPGKKIIPIIHPSAALRKYIFQHYILFDLFRVKKESKTPSIILPKKNLLTGDDWLSNKLYLERIQINNNTIAFDIEVVNEEVSCISFATCKDAAISIPFTTTYTLEQEAELWTVIADILENPNILKVGQNLTFDSTFLFRKYGIRVTNIEDTMVAQAIINPDFPKALDFIVSIYTNEPYYKDDLKKYSKGFSDQETFWRYNARDSAVCLEALPKMKKDLITLDNTEVYKTQCKLIEPLVYMAEKGIRVDTIGMQKESQRLQEEITSLKEELNSIAGKELNPNSNKQLKEYFYITKGIRPYKSRTGTNKGVITVDKHALKRISRLGHREAKIILKARALMKQKSTYLDMKIPADGRVRCSFNPVGGDGRLSSSTNIFDEGGNLQNIPHPILKFFLADEDYIIYNADLEQADARVVAYIAPESNMINIFEKDLDIHVFTASRIFDKDPGSITRTSGTCPICDDPEICGHEGERFWGKKALHSFNYGLGEEQFSFLFEISRDKSRMIRRGYLKAYPGIQNYWSWVQNELKKNRSLTDCYGWTRRFMDRWGGQLFKQAYSFIPRSTVAATINRNGILKIWDDKELSKVELLNQVHDSIVFQIPVNAGWEYHEFVLRRIKANLETPVRWKGIGFIIPAEVKMGLNLGDVIKLHNITKEEVKANYLKLKGAKEHQ